MLTQIVKTFLDQGWKLLLQGSGIFYNLKDMTPPSFGC